MVGDWFWYPCVLPTPFHSSQESAATMGVGKNTGGRHNLQLHWSSGGCLCLCTGLQAATAFQMNSLSLSISLFASGSPSQVPVGWPSLICTHLPSLARLLSSPSFSHSLSLLVTLCLFFSSPFVSRTCPCSLTGSFSLFPPLFLQAFGLSPQPCQELANLPPAPPSPSAYKPCLIASSLGKISK